MLTNVNTVILHQDEIHLFVDENITKHKAQRGRAFFYKKPKKYEVIGEKRIMKFDIKDFIRKVRREPLHPKKIC